MSHLITLQAAVHLASNVGAAHARSMNSLSHRRQLWVAVGSLPAHYQALHDGVKRSQWVREPPNSAESTHLAEASRDAQRRVLHAVTVLDTAIPELLSPHISDVTSPQKRPQPIWETVVTPPRHPEHGHTPSTATPVIDAESW